MTPRNRINGKRVCWRVYIRWWTTDQFLGSVEKTAWSGGEEICVSPLLADGRLPSDMITPAARHISSFPSCGIHNNEDFASGRFCPLLASTTRGICRFDETCCNSLLKILLLLGILIHPLSLFMLLMLRWKRISPVERISSSICFCIQQTASKLIGCCKSISNSKRNPFNLIFFLVQPWRRIPWQQSEHAKPVLMVGFAHRIPARSYSLLVGQVWVIYITSSANK